MTEFADIYSSDLTIDFLLWGSFVLLVACMIGAIWLTRARERTESARPSAADAGRLAKRTAA
jgi:cytochrome c-type biogenesis protein CcmH/NrfF